METNLEQQSPKLNVTNVSSAVFGKEEGATLGKESSIGKLARILRTTRLKVNEVEKSITGISAKFLEIDKKITLNTENITGNTKKTETNAEKITRLKKIFQNQKSNIGEKLPGSTEEKEKAKLNTTLTETNRILVEIQKQLAYDFAMRAAEDKKEVAEDKEATSKERFKREESALEKSAKAMVSTVKTATKKIVSPIGNIFEKLLTFIGILGAGIATNAAFEWFKDPENQKKITKFFNILKQNWKLLRNVLLTVVAAGVVIKVISALAIIGKVLALLASGPGLAVIGGVLLAMGASKAAEHFRKIKEKKALEQEVSLGIKDPSKIGGDDGMTFEEYKIFNYMEPGIPDYKTDPRPARIKARVKEVFSPDFDVMDEIPTITQGTKSFGDRVGDFFRPLGNFMYGEGFDKREKGGPVTAKTPYLVGEGGPEIFAPNVDGSVINNMKTEKIYQMLASGKKGRTRIVELPPQTIEGPKPEIKMPRGPATKAPKISSSNSLDGYRSVSSGIYGIMV